MKIKDFIPPILCKIYNRLTEDREVRKNRLSRRCFMDSQFWNSYDYIDHVDILVDYLLNFKEKGTFIEIGASNPEASPSITKRFYDRGWNSINIEPCTDDYRALCEQRPNAINLNVCVAEKNGTLPFYELKGNTHGSSLNLRHAKRIKGRILEKKIEVISLDELYRKYPNNADFVVIDVEGYELNVVKGNNWYKNRPKVLIIETVQQDYVKITGFLKEKGYLLIYNNYLNSIYIDIDSFKNDKRFLL